MIIEAFLFTGRIYTCFSEVSIRNTISHFHFMRHFHHFSWFFVVKMNGKLDFRSVLFEHRNSQFE